MYNNIYSLYFAKREFTPKEVCMKSAFKLSFITIVLCTSILFASCINTNNNPIVDTETNDTNTVTETQQSDETSSEVIYYEELILTSESGKTADIISKLSAETISYGKSLRGEMVFTTEEPINNIEFTFKPDGTFLRTTTVGEQAIEEILVWDYVQGPPDSGGVIVIRKAEEQNISWIYEDISFVEVWRLHNSTENGASFYILSQAGQENLIFDTMIIAAVKDE